MFGLAFIGVPQRRATNDDRPATQPVAGWLSLRLLEQRDQRVNPLLHIGNLNLNASSAFRA
jgi:hypothetical protein